YILGAAVSLASLGKLACTARLALAVCLHFSSLIACVNERKFLFCLDRTRCPHPHESLAPIRNGYARACYRHSSRGTPWRCNSRLSGRWLCRAFPHLSTFGQQKFAVALRGPDWRRSMVSIPCRSSARQP